MEKESQEQAQAHLEHDPKDEKAPSEVMEANVNEDQNFYCEFCKPCLRLILEHDDQEDELILEGKIIRVKVQDLDTLYAYLQCWVNKSCPCIFRRTKNVDKFCALIKKIMLFSVQMLKRLGRKCHTNIYTLTPDITNLCYVKSPLIAKFLDKKVPFY